MNCKLAFPVPLHKVFDYKVPDDIAPKIKPGMRVFAPFGWRKLTGIVTEVYDGAVSPEIKIKSIEKLIDEKPLCDGDVISLAQFISLRWGSPLGEVLHALIPSCAGLLSETVPPPAEKAEIFSPQLPAQDGLAALEESVVFGEGGVTLIFGNCGEKISASYLRLAGKALSLGGQALFMFPSAGEMRISLPEEKMLRWHGKLTPAQRKKIWARIANGEPLVILGTRSACLLPFKNLRFAVVCNEHDEVYKQEDIKPHYHARDVMLERAETGKYPLILQSPSPSMQSLYSALSGKIKLIRVKDNCPAPEIIFIPNHGPGFIDEKLKEKIAGALSSGQKAFVMLNRKGYGFGYACRECGWTPRCAKCKVMMAEHKLESETFLQCPRCLVKAAPPALCHKCGKSAFRTLGGGTERAVSELGKIFPSAKIIRFESDTLKTKGGEGHKIREADIIVGTKMLAHSFISDGVSVAAALNVDAELNSPDFRASEKVCQLLMKFRQSKAMLIQTERPEEDAFKPLTSGDYMDFASAEFETRKNFNYPPYSVLIKVSVTSKTDKMAVQACEIYMEHAKTLAESFGSPFEISGPAKSATAKTSKTKTCYFLIKTPAQDFTAFFLSSCATYKPTPTVSCKITPDPYNFR